MRALKFAIFFTLIYITSCKNYKIELTSTSPVALDVPIWFHAEIKPYDGKKFTFYWEDDLNFRHSMDVNGPRANWSIIYPSVEYEMLTGKRRVTVKVYEKSSLKIFPLATNSIIYSLDEWLSGVVELKQENVTNIKAGSISTLNTTNLTISLHDPYNWIKNRTEKATFYFHVNNKETNQRYLYGPCATSSALVNITEPGKYIIEGTAILLISDDIITTTSTTTTTTTEKPTTTTAKPNTTTAKPKMPSTTIALPSKPSIGDDLPYKCTGNPFTLYEYPMSGAFHHKYAMSYVSLTAGVPLNNLKIVGETWLSDGALLELNVVCNGTGPYHYCVNITFGAFHPNDPMMCNRNKIYSSTCQFPIIQYLRRKGTYSLVVAVENEVSQGVYRYGVNVYDSDKKQNLSYIIVPVTCLAVAIIIILFGVAQYIQNKNIHAIEVADFDFCASESAVYKPFVQQLREAITSSCTADFFDERSRIEHPRFLDDDPTFN